MKINVTNFKKYFQTIKPLIANNDLLASYVILDFETKKAMFTSYDKIAMVDFDCEGEYEKRVIAVDGTGFLNLVNLTKKDDDGKFSLDYDNNFFKVNTIKTKLKSSGDVDEDNYKSKLTYFGEINLEIPLDPKFYYNLDKIVKSIPKDPTQMTFLGCTLFKEEKDGEVILECRATDSKKLFMDFYEDESKFPSDTLQIPENVLKTIISFSDDDIAKTKIYRNSESYQDISKYRLENEGINVYVSTNSDLNIPKGHFDIPVDSYFEVNPNLILDSFNKLAKILSSGEQVKLQLNADNTIDIEFRESFSEQLSNIVKDKLSHESINIQECLKGNEFQLDFKNFREGLTYFIGSPKIKILMNDRMLNIKADDKDFEYLCVLAVRD